MTTCPHCGAGQADRLAYGCGTKTYANIRGEDCYDVQVDRLEAEIARLRALLDNPQAKPLEWKKPYTLSDKYVANGIHGAIWIERETLEWVITGNLPFVCPVLLTTLESAQAHAEELHQAEWRETMKWSVYYKESK